jgi:hypothetical protein
VGKISTQKREKKEERDMNSALAYALRWKPLRFASASAERTGRKEKKRGEHLSGCCGSARRRRRRRRRRRGGGGGRESFLRSTSGEEEMPSSSGDDDDESDDGKKKKNKNRMVKITVKGEEVIRYAIPNFFPDLNDVAFEPEETIEEIGRRRPPEEEEEKKIYVWKRGMELEEKKVVRENQAKIDALYNPPSALTTSTTTTREEKRERREETKDILGKYAKAKEEETRETPSMASRALLFATVFAYALGLVLTTHRGVVDLSTPAPMECEAGDATCTKETLPKRVEVFVSLDE